MSKVAPVIDAHIRAVLDTVEERYTAIQRWVQLDKKLQSEFISKLIQTAFADIAPNTRQGKGDHEADVYIDGYALELKTIHKLSTWRGGEFSKRAGDYLLISWDMRHGTLYWFVTHVWLEKDAWKSSGSANYYATTISLDDAMARGGRILVGHVRKARKHYHPIHASLAPLPSLA